MTIFLNIIQGKWKILAMNYKYLHIKVAGWCIYKLLATLLNFIISYKFYIFV